MQKIANRDLVIRLDEQRDVLQLLAPKKGGEVGELRAFYEFSVEEIHSTESLEHYVGTIVLAFLSANYTTNSFRLDQYRQAGQEFCQLMSDEVTALLDSGDGDSEFEGAMLRLSFVDETWSLEDVDKITALLVRAAGNGSEKAAHFLRDDWPIRSKILKKRLGRATGN